MYVLKINWILNQQKSIRKVENKKKRLIIQNSSHSGKQHQYNFVIFLGLGRFAESFYNGNLSLKAVNIEQRNMEDIIRKLEYYDPKKKNTEHKKQQLVNAKEL